MDETNISLTMISLFILFGFVLFILILVILYRVAKRKKIKLMLATYEEQYEDILGKLHQLEEKLAPLFKFSDGLTKQKLASVDHQFYELLQQTTAFAEKIRAYKYMKPSKINHAAYHTFMMIQGQLRGFNQTADELACVLAEMQTIQSEAIALINEEKTIIQELKSIFSSLQLKYNYSFSTFLSQLAVFETRLEELEQLSTFDVISAIDQLKEQLTLLHAWTEAIGRLDAIEYMLLHFDEQVNEVKTDINLQLNDFNLPKESLNPYLYVDKAAQIYASFKAHFINGEFLQCISEIALIQEKFSASKQLVRKYIIAKEQSPQKILLLETKYNQYKQLADIELGRVIRKIKEIYHQVHYNESAHNESEIQQELAQYGQLLNHAKQLYTKKMYLECSDELTKVEKKIESLYLRIKQMLNLLHELERNRFSIINEVDAMKNRVNQIKINAQRAFTVYEQNQRIVHAEQAIVTTLQNLASIATSTPYYLVDVHERMKMAQQLIAQYASLVQEALRHYDRSFSTQELIRTTMEAELRRQYQRRDKGGGSHGGKLRSRGGGGGYLK